MSEQPLLEVCLSPALLHLYDLERTIVVVIDIFRASSTICAALDNGAEAVIPISSAEECLSYQKKEDGGHIITAGERDGKVIPGLNHGNSPLEYSADVIQGKTLVLTTTNGTRLLHMAQAAEKIIIGSFLNLSAVCEYLQNANRKVLLACAAWKDRVNMEDTLFAGAVVERLKPFFDLKCDSAHIANSMYQQSAQFPTLLEGLKGSSHYRRLSSFGLQADLEYCTTPDLHPVVPIFNGVELLADKVSAEIK